MEKFIHKIHNCDICTSQTVYHFVFKGWCSRFIYRVLYGTYFIIVFFHLYLYSVYWL